MQSRRKISAPPANDDFGARYYSNRFGRWLSADWSSVPVPVPYANLTNPQTLNLYSMVADDPESFADLDGHTGYTYQVANPAASSAWDPGGVVNSMTNDSGLTDEEVGSLNSFRAAEAAQQGYHPKITCDSHLSGKDRATAESKVGAAIDVINKNWSKLSADEQNIISKMNVINVFAGDRGGMDFKTMTFNLSINSINDTSSTARLATDIAHDSYHIKQFGTGEMQAVGPLTTPDGRRAARQLETNATNFQIGVGKKLGLSRSEIRELRYAAAHPEKFWRWLAD